MELLAAVVFLIDIWARSAILSLETIKERRVSDQIEVDERSF